MLFFLQCLLIVPILSKFYWKNLCSFLSVLINLQYVSIILSFIHQFKHLHFSKKVDHVFVFVFFVQFITHVQQNKLNFYVLFNLFCNIKQKHIKVYIKSRNKHFHFQLEKNTPLKCTTHTTSQEVKVILMLFVVTLLLLCCLI